MILLGFERDTGNLAISTGFHNPDWRTRRFDVDYWVPTPKQGRGYAAETVNALLRYAFTVMGARIVTLGHAEGNEASQAVIRKLGFTHSVRKPFDYEMTDGRLVDGHGYYRLGTEDLPPLDVSWG